ncbi:hypothetical protein Efla_006596 [Eimeria flavescens]
MRDCLSDCLLLSWLSLASGNAKGNSKVSLINFLLSLRPSVCTVARLVASLERPDPQQQQQQEPGVSPAKAGETEKTKGKSEGKGTPTRKGTSQETAAPKASDAKAAQGKEQQQRAAAAAKAAAAGGGAPQVRGDSKEKSIERKLSAATAERLRQPSPSAEGGPAGGGDDPSAAGDDPGAWQDRLKDMLKVKGLRLRRRQQKGSGGIDSYKDPEVRRRVRELIEAGVWKGHEDEYEIVPEYAEGDSETGLTGKSSP